jgi:putative tryptophan/tyrosine transport system permease protein
MAQGMGINTGLTKIFGLAMANGLVALSGFLVVQLQGFADINMGIGIVILGLGAVMIGERIFFSLKGSGLLLRLSAAVAGSVVFRLILSLALSAGIDPVWLKLLTAVIVLLIVGVPGLMPTVRQRIKIE